MENLIIILITMDMKLSMMKNKQFMMTRKSLTPMTMIIIHSTMMTTIMNMMMMTWTTT